MFYLFVAKRYFLMRNKDTLVIVDYQDVGTILTTGLGLTITKRFHMNGLHGLFFHSNFCNNVSISLIFHSSIN